MLNERNICVVRENPVDQMHCEAVAPHHQCRFVIGSTGGIERELLVANSVQPMVYKDFGLDRDA